MAQIVVYRSVGAAPGYVRGDLVSLHDDGEHLGTAIVPGQAWDGPVSATSNLAIIDTTGTAQQVKDAIRQRVLPERVSLRLFNRIFMLDVPSIPLAIRQQMSTSGTGRATATWAQIRDHLMLRPGLTRESLIQRLTINGRWPEGDR